MFHHRALRIHRLFPPLFICLALDVVGHSQNTGVPDAVHQENVDRQQATTQQNVLPSSEIPTPETYRKQKAVAKLDPHDQKLIEALANKRYDLFAVEFAREPSSGWAEAMAWEFYREGKADAAQMWFHRALRIDPSDANAEYGLALLAKNEGRWSEAAAAASQDLRQPKMRQLLQQIDLIQAQKHYDRKEYQFCLNELNQADKLVPLTLDHKGWRAWVYYQMGQYQEAAREFDELYRKRPSKNFAQGLFFSLQRLNHPEEAEGLAQKLGGPLVGMVADQQAEDYYNRDLFLAAEKASPRMYPALEHVDSPSLVTGAAFRQKTGQSGLSRLDEEDLPFATASYVTNGTDRFTIGAMRLGLNSGDLTAHAVVGSFPVIPRSYSFSPLTQLDDLAIARFTFIHEADFSPYLEVGTTPLNGPVSFLPTGRLGFIQQSGKGNWGLELSSHSNTESILSYAGLRDPYGGGVWGRVQETGLTAFTYQDLGSDWGLNGQGSIGILTGEGVKENEHASLTIGIGRDLRLPEFQYFVLGPEIYTEHFKYNLSGFTLGQGGYFSPDYLAQATMDLNFLTLEGEQYLFRCHFGLGGQCNQQDSSPLFPLAPDGRSYASSQDASYVLSSKVEGVMRISDHWQWGGCLSFNRTADYSEATEMVFIRFLFEPRPAVFSSDLVSAWP